tara:strand:- start:268 stop:933 length:666 start_codon:yes stop_codon:yes gene_type:complete
VDKKNKLREAKELLTGAYEIKTPEDSLVYYKDFSKIYDDTYVEGMSYVYHKYVARELISYFKGEGSVCDIGCGTGLVGQELIKLNSKLIIDGVDISPDMLAVADTKKVYRNLYPFDLTKPIERLPKDYKGIISSGTFTHGHLGPQSLVNLLSLCDEEAILTIGINGLHYIEKGFKKTLDDLEKSKKIKMLNIVQQDIYSQQLDLDNQKNQKAMICTFKNIK